MEVRGSSPVQNYQSPVAEERSVPTTPKELKSPSSPSQPFSPNSGKGKMKRLLDESEGNSPSSPPHKKAKEKSAEPTGTMVPVLLPPEMVLAIVERADGMTIANSMRLNRALGHRIRNSSIAIAAIQEAQVSCLAADQFMTRLDVELRMHPPIRNPDLLSELPAHGPYLKKAHVQRLINAAFNEGPNGYIKGAMLWQLLKGRSSDERADVEQRVMGFPELAKEFWKGAFQEVAQKGDMDFADGVVRRMRGTKHLCIPFSVFSVEQREVVLAALADTANTKHLENLLVEKLSTTVLQRSDTLFSASDMAGIKKAMADITAANSAINAAFC